MADDEPTGEGDPPDTTRGWGGSGGDDDRPEPARSRDRPGSAGEGPGSDESEPAAAPGSAEGEPADSPGSVEDESAERAGAAAGEPVADHETYEVFVQWQRGKPHEHAETVNAPDHEMALHLAKRNVDVRSEPVSIMVAPRSEIRETAPGDTTLVPSTDRSYRNVGWYAEHRDDGGEG